MMHYESMPKMDPVGPDADLEARVRRALYEDVVDADLEDTPSGAVAAFVVMAAFVAFGFAVYWVLS